MTPQPLPADCLDMQSAWLAGISSHVAGFGQAMNPYTAPARLYKSSRETRLMEWAFDLEWRECAWLELRAKVGAR